MSCPDLLHSKTKFNTFKKIDSLPKHVELGDLVFEKGSTGQTKFFFEAGMHTFKGLEEFRKKLILDGEKSNYRRFPEKQALQGYWYALIPAKFLSEKSLKKHYKKSNLNKAKVITLS